MNSLLAKRTQTVYAPGGGSVLPGSKSVDGGVVALSTNDVSKAVTFGVGFTSAPSPTGQILLPDNTQSGIDCWPDESTRTALGVTFLFGAAIPASGFKLAWNAVGS